MPFYNKKHGIFYTVPCFYFYQLYAKLLNILDKKRRFSMLQSAYISIISGASLWGLIALFFKFLTACGFSPLQIVALRVLFAAVLMTAVIFKIDPKLLKSAGVTAGFLSELEFSAWSFSTTVISALSKSVQSLLQYCFYIQHRFL